MGSYQSSKAQTSRKSFRSWIQFRSFSRRNIHDDNPIPFSSQFERPSRNSRAGLPSRQNNMYDPSMLDSPQRRDTRRESSERMFGETVPLGETNIRNDDVDKKSGFKVLSDFIDKFGPVGATLRQMLQNKTPLTQNVEGYRYVIHQSTERSDADIVLRDLCDGRLSRQGARYIVASWARLFFGDTFLPSKNRRPSHDLVYSRSRCSCLHCCINYARAEHEPENSSDVTRTASTIGYERVPAHAAHAESVEKVFLPSIDDLRELGAEVSHRDLPIGQICRLNSPTSSKLEFTPEVKELFGSLLYSGPISHEELFRKVTTMGVAYYRHNKGKKTRQVYLRGLLIRVPIEIGLVKNSAYPMHYRESGSTYVLYKRQMMSIYHGQIELEGNTIGSFIGTGIKYFIGFGQEDGAAPLYPDGRGRKYPHRMGRTRRLGVNELLLHHHQTLDFEVVCR